MLIRFLGITSLLVLAAGCTWPPRAAVPVSPQQAADVAERGSDSTARRVDEVVGTTDRTLRGVSRTPGGMTQGVPSLGGGGGGLLR